jgi:hypothetical protein
LNIKWLDYSFFFLGGIHKRRFIILNPSTTSDNSIEFSKALKEFSREGIIV